MGLSSLRALLLSLAMVLQTVAAGAMAAAPRSEGLDRAAVEHCAQHAGQRNDASPAQNRADHKHCDKCLACCGVQGAALLPQTIVLLKASFTSRVALAKAIEAPPETTISLICGARGPPLAHA